MVAEAVSIDGISLTAELAWDVVDYTDLYGRGPARGSDVVLAGVAGESPRARILGAWRFTIPMLVRGTYDGQTGLPAAVDPRITLGANLDYLRTNLVAPYATDTVTLVHTRQDGSTRSGACVVEDMQLAPHDGQRGHVVRCLLRVTVAAGELT